MAQFISYDTVLRDDSVKRFDPLSAIKSIDRIDKPTQYTINLRSGNKLVIRDSENATGYANVHNWLLGETDPIVIDTNTCER